MLLQDMQQFCRLLGILVGQYEGGGNLRIALDGLPSWFGKLMVPPQGQVFAIEEHFPFLGGFVPDAEVWWSDQKETLLQSGIWNEATHSDEDLHLDAAATTFNGRALLLIGPFFFDLDKLQDILQRARQIHLDHEALERAERALAASEARQRQILDAFPDTYLMCDGDGRVTEHNHPSYPPVDRQKPLSLGEMLGPAAARAIADHGIHPGVFEYEVPLGNGSRTFEGRLVATGDGGFLCLVRDISEARELERSKAEFLSIAGHELRTPLTSIKASMSMVHKKFADELPPPVARMLDIAARNSERLVNLVNDLLEIQRIDLSTRALSLQVLDLAPLLKRVIEENRGFAHEQDVVLDLQLVGTPVVRADEDALIQVLTNLVSNGVKYSPPGDTLLLRACAREAWVELSVRDNGPGIPDAYQARIFQRFPNIPGSDRANMKSTGLGLSLCRTLVEEMNGEISFTTGVSGTTFLVKLPPSS